MMDIQIEEDALQVFLQKLYFYAIINNVGIDRARAHQLCCSLFFYS
jgi:hypothetical protein